jgi:L-histidine Nalpha-methyltransferase
MEQLTILKGLAEDTRKGLASKQKYLLPKYFYNSTGSRIFQDIMHMEEYYLTNCEHDVFVRHKAEMAKTMKHDNSFFDLIEFGSGDGLKTKILLSQLYHDSSQFRYVPVDISRHANNELVKGVKQKFPAIDVLPKNGDYFHVMKKLAGESEHRKVILFLGANIGNFSQEEARDFLHQVYQFMHKGDQLLIGFDLKKSPKTILKAYDDPHGHTKRFNLNHLQRLNDELGADFNIEKFLHHTSYDPISGAVKSFLISTEEQSVYIKAIEQKVYFTKWEPIIMELSQKYDLGSIRALAENNDFSVLQNFFDKKEYFVDSLWEKGA